MQAGLPARSARQRARLAAGKPSQSKSPFAGAALLHEGSLPRRVGKRVLRAWCEGHPHSGQTARRRPSEGSPPAPKGTCRRLPTPSRCCRAASSGSLILGRGAAFHAPRGYPGAKVAPRMNHALLQGEASNSGDAALPPRSARAQAGAPAARRPQLHFSLVPPPPSS